MYEINDQIEKIERELKILKDKIWIEFEKKENIGIIELDNNIRIDRNKYYVIANDEKVKLSCTQYDLLLYLAERKGEIKNFDEIYRDVWKVDMSIYEDYYKKSCNMNISVAVARINSRLGHKIIKNVRQRGYYIE
jgi:DNA-binding response OmpR family regulator